MLELFPEGFVEDRRGDSVELAAFTDELGADRLRKIFGEVLVEPVPPGWEDEWKRFHQPVEVGSLWIGPPWVQPAAGLQRVVIDPGRAFGTGAHATTQLCVEILHALERGSLLDVGCGSGVLAISACRLGFAPVIAIDSDEAAVEATKRNAEANGVDVDVRRVDAEDEPLPAAEIAIANIDLATLARFSPPSECRLLVTSGYHEAERPTVDGFDHLERRARSTWAADLFMRK